MKISDLYTGYIDAKNEILANEKQSTERFLRGFFMPMNIKTDQYRDKKKFFVSGAKGTGKTALLRYFSLTFSQETRAFSRFVLFKSDFSEEDREHFLSAASSCAIVKNNANMEEQDFENLWTWFIHRQIVDEVESKKVAIDIEKESWSNYSNLVKSPIHNNEISGFWDLLPKLQTGFLEISSKPKLKFDFSWADKEKRLVRVSDFVRSIEGNFLKLLPTVGKIWLFFDELEINISSKDTYNRDIRLIRDLIISIARFNLLAKQRNISIGILAGVRSEVLSAIDGVGKEINKLLLDFGSKINWSHGEAATVNHPLLKIVLNRICISDSLPMPCDNYEKIWQEYFPKQIGRSKKTTLRYLLDQTWLRPRDFVRILMIAKDQFPDETSFSEKVFLGIEKEYSMQSWTEIAEELTSKYTKGEIEGIKQVLNGFKNIFSLQEAQVQFSKKAKNYKDVGKLMTKVKVAEVLSDLYHMGVLGNHVWDPDEGVKIQFAHRGDLIPIIEGEFVVHAGLVRYFNLKIV